MPGRDELDSLLDELLAEPGRREELERRIAESFVAERAVLVLDMSGFSRTTQTFGIVEYLLVIRRLRALATPVVAELGGDIVKAEADNLFCLFPSVPAAVAASREIASGLEGAGAPVEGGRELYVSVGIGYGPVLLIGDEDMMGNEVNLACKLGEDVAEYGEILLTEAAARELAGAETLDARLVSVSGLELRHHALVS
ncbi:MAG: adenylate/guanylate cyclase domain-containing protein [Actinobacteria bacterium]|nr:adenylate/guanylate cyclase domain-containing protein [Actinomycetota bacterium]